MIHDDDMVTLASCDLTRPLTAELVQCGDRYGIARIDGEHTTMIARFTTQQEAAEIARAVMMGDRIILTNAQTVRILAAHVLRDAIQGGWIG
ncbi:MAG: hypothetical protein ACK50Q_11070 [Labrys sp. (in: a-proteobacteria)]